MKEILQETKCLASLAVFRELYNSNRNIYGIISEFLKEIISANGKHQFSLTEITQLLNDTFDFSIPEAIVSTSLNRFKDSYSKSYGYYTITKPESFAITGKLSGECSATFDNNKIIIDNLFKFIETEKLQGLSEDEKQKIVHSFCSYIIDESTTQNYSNYISAFILKGREDPRFINSLNTIKEGVILYTGLKYNPDLNELGSWKSDLVIFLETEILFHLAGYNGELYRTLFNDFYKLVKEINHSSLKKGGKRLIHLKFFPEIKDEIERFFRKAEHIVEGKEKANPSKTAMTSIIDGCRTPAEVVEKKVRFYELLNSLAIYEDDYDEYYSSFNHKFNIVDSSLLTDVSEKTGIDDASPYLKYLNFVRIRRKGISNRGFDNAGYFLLSGTRNTIFIAWNEAIKSIGEVPLASDLNFITNKLWFKLNKGFGDNEYPKTFDIVTKAQIVLSSQLNDSVADKFEELQIKYRDGRLTEEQAVASIVELRRQARKPEEINEYDYKDVLSSIEEKSIEDHLKEQELLKHKATKFEQESKELKKKMERSKIEKQQSEEEYKDALIKKDQEISKTREELEKYKQAERIKKNKRDKIIRRLKQIAVVGLISAFITIGIILDLHSESLYITLISIVAGFLTVSLFFGFDYKALKALFKKDQ